MGKVHAGVGPKYPQVVVLIGATGDLSQRKLLPGLFHLISAGFIPGCRIIGVSLDELDADVPPELAEAINLPSGEKLTAPSINPVGTALALTSCGVPPSTDIFRIL